MDAYFLSSLQQSFVTITSCLQVNSWNLLPMSAFNVHVQYVLRTLHLEPAKEVLNVVFTVKFTVWTDPEQSVISMVLCKEFKDLDREH
jgi:hypothetical protein